MYSDIHVVKLLSSINYDFANYFLRHDQVLTEVPLNSDSPSPPLKTSSDILNLSGRSIHSYHRITEDDELETHEEPEESRSMDSYTIAMEHGDKLVISPSYNYM